MKRASSEDFEFRLLCKKLIRLIIKVIGMFHHEVWSTGIWIKHENDSSVICSKPSSNLTNRMSTSYLWVGGNPSMSYISSYNVKVIILLFNHRSEMSTRHVYWITNWHLGYPCHKFNFCYTRKYINQYQIRLIVIQIASGHFPISIFVCLKMW